MRSPSRQSHEPNSTKKRPSPLVFVEPNEFSQDDLSQEDSNGERGFEVYHDSQGAAGGQDDSSTVNPNTMSILIGLSKARSNLAKATKKIEDCKGNLDGGSEGKNSHSVSQS